jgi:CheY-like chemotaxis protein
VAIADTGLNLRRILSSHELIAGEQVFFAATGITDGPLLTGVRDQGERAETQSLILRADTGSRRVMYAENVAYNGRIVTKAEHHSTMHTPITIASVEDGRFISEFLREVLRDAGDLERAYPDGGSGLAAIIAQPPAFVLLDLNLPSMRGEDVLVGIRQHLGAALPIVLMIASLHRRNWAGQGATAFLAKPFTIEHMLAIIARAIASTT